MDGNVLQAGLNGVDLDMLSVLVALLLLALLYAMLLPALEEFFA